MSEDSYIKPFGEGGAVFAGPDAVRLFAAASLLSGLRLWQRGIMVTRGVTLKLLLAKATEYTGKTYRGRRDIDAAIADVDKWAKEMRAALPVVRGAGDGK